VSAEEDILLELSVGEGDLLMYFVDGDDGDAYIADPSPISFDTSNTSFDPVDVSGTFGVSDQQLRIDNATGSEVELAVALDVTTFEDDAKWEDGEEEFLAYSTDGTSGGLLVDPSGIVLTDDGCGGVSSTMTSARFAYGSEIANVESIDILNTTGGTECRFDLTNLLLTQTIPPRTPAGNYSLGMVLTLTAGEHQGDFWGGPPPCGGETALVDTRDGDKEYAIVEIGDQCWMAENLDYDDGCGSVTWVNSSDEGWCGYHQDDTGETHGLVYQWSAAMSGDDVPVDDLTTSVQGICPDGWLLPSKADFEIF
jgi:hypothetical protein